MASHEALTNGERRCSGLGVQEYRSLKLGFNFNHIKYI